VTLNCAAVPGELIESELFGHEKGSFTGATERRQGKFEQANHGTLFLDEVGDMPLMMQTKLLRALEQGVVERVGGSRSIQVDVRVIVATHRDLMGLVKTGGFREDLFYRLYVYLLVLPPLRDRAEDVPELVEHFAHQFARRSAPVVFTPAAIEQLERYHWPGNVRELRNIIERLVLLADGPFAETDVRQVLPENTKIAGKRPLQGSLSSRVDDFEREQILSELKSHNQNVKETAEALGIPRTSLYKKCEALGIDIRAVRNTSES
jgi:DNA-binding NtrC family response regulator